MVTQTFFVFFPFFFVFFFFFWLLLALSKLWAHKPDVTSAGQLTTSLWRAGVVWVHFRAYKHLYTHTYVQIHVSLCMVIVCVAEYYHVAYCTHCPSGHTVAFVCSVQFICCFCTVCKFCFVVFTKMVTFMFFMLFYNFFFLWFESSWNS